MSNYNGIHYIPGRGMYYDPRYYEFEEGGLFSPSKAYKLEYPSVEAGGGPPQRTELTGMMGGPNQGISTSGQRALAAGTLGAKNEAWPMYQKMAMENPLPQLISSLGALQNLSQGAAKPRPGQPYQNEVLMRLIGGL